MFFLKFLLIMFLAAIAIVVMFAFRIFRSFNDVRKQFQNMGQQQQNHRTYGKDDDQEVVIDQRTPEEAARKIIPKDEGEYVDFKEE